MEIIAIIPARYGSTRFEGKPLATILGKPMIQWVYEGVCQSKLIDKVLVATDDQRIMEAVEQFGGNPVMTSSAHATGSDRVAEVARKLKAEIIVNVQGDEPLLKGAIIDKAIRPLMKDPSIPLSTLMTRIEEVKDWINPNVAKVVVDQKGFALYFSRSPIPFPRDLNIEKLLSSTQKGKSLLPHRVFKHIGVYVYRRDFLLRYSKMEHTPVDYEPLSVDTPEDLRKVIAYISQQSDESRPHRI
jgi:3-deoxy-manno-octulosonate cytidylyltransferase (CMP-KDO synthetase)